MDAPEREDSAAALRELQAVSAALDRIQDILQEMYRMAQRAAAPDCTPAERALLQRDMDAYTRRIERLAARCGDAGGEDVRHEKATV